MQNRISQTRKMQTSLKQDTENDNMSQSIIQQGTTRQEFLMKAMVHSKFCSGLIKHFYGILNQETLSNQRTVY